MLQRILVLIFLRLDLLLHKELADEVLCLSEDKIVNKHINIKSKKENLKNNQGYEKLLTRR